MAINKIVNKEIADREKGFIEASGPAPAIGANVASAARLRRSPRAARDNVLAAAERILTGSGPQNLKLAEVAKAAGVATATVLHHFGSIDGVQAALMDRMVTSLVERIVAITTSNPAAMLAEEADIALFDAFEAQGAARLAAWMVMTGEVTQLHGVRAAVEQVVNLTLAHIPDPPPRIVIEDLILASITAALGAGLFGAPLSALLGRPVTSARTAIMAALAAHTAQVGLIDTERESS